MIPSRLSSQDILPREPLALGSDKDQIIAMASNADRATSKRQKAVVLGRSAATGRVVLAPVVSKKGSVSQTRIAAAVKSVLAKRS